MLVARDRQKPIFSGIVGQGCIVKDCLDKAIGSKLTPTNVLYTDAWPAFKTYAKEKGMEHYTFKSDGKERVKGLYHNKNVHNYHSRLKNGMHRFNGGGDQIFEHYLSWLLFLETVSHSNNKTSISKMMVESSLISIRTTHKSLRLSEYRP